MPSRLEIAIRRQRQALLRQETEAVQRVLRAYDGSRVELIRRIDAFAHVVQERDLSASEAIRFDRAQELFAQVEEEVARLAGLTHRTVIDTQEQMAAQASSNALQLVQASAPRQAASIASSWNRLNPDAVQALVGRMADGSPLEATLRQFGDAARPALEDAITTAIVTGQGPRAAAQQMAQYVDGESYKLLRLSRTEILNSYRTATLESYRANADISTGQWTWVASSSSNTCLSCLFLDGQSFSIDEPFQPCHPQCRCSSILELKGIDSPSRKTGSEWFDEQPEDVQRSMVPPSAWNDFSNGDLTLGDFNQYSHDPQWGGSYRQASVQDAKAAAAERRAA